MIHTKYEPNRNAPVPPKLLRSRTQPIHGQTAMHLPDTNPTTAPCRVISSGWHCKAPHAGWEDPDGLLGSRRAEIRRVTPGTWCFVYAVGKNVEDGVSPMRDEVDVMNGRPFVPQLGVANLWGRRKLGVSSDYLVPFANVPQVVAKTGEKVMEARLQGNRELVRSRPRCYRRHPIGRSNFEERFGVAQVACQKEGLLHPLAIVRLSGATPQRDVKLDTLGGKLELSPIRTHGGAESLILSCQGCGQMRQGSNDRAWRSLRCDVRERAQCLSSCVPRAVQGGWWAEGRWRFLFLHAPLQLCQPSVPGWALRSEGRRRGEDRQGDGSHSYARDEKGPQRSRAAGGSGLYNYAAMRLSVLSVGRRWQISDVCVALSRSQTLGPHLTEA